MLHLYQQLTGLRSSAGREYLVAALGPKIILTEGGKIVSEWTNSSDVSSQVEDDDEERPSKKQKTSDQIDPADNEIALLATSSDGGAIAAVIADKTLVVFKVRSDGNLQEDSRRIMPKRPSALQIISNSATILCADKFGDVYALPLFLDQTWTYSEPESAKSATVLEEPLFKPSATELTVHSKRNRDALASQHKQRAFTPRKAPLAYEHKLVIGHVSMLTDMVYLQGSNVATSRIVTADRDEHIRISRNLPQAHIIEGYCMGHEEFVSKLCPIRDSSLLISGGGDDWLGLWDLSTYQLKHKIDIRQPLEQNELVGSSADAKLAVSLLHEIPTSTAGEATVLAACEKIAAILVVSLVDNSTSIEVFKTDCNPISMAVLNMDRVVVSFDARETSQPRLRSLKLLRKGTSTTLVEDLDNSLPQLNAIDTVTSDPATLDSSLYCITSFRKRRGWGNKEEEERDSE